MNIKQELGDLKTKCRLQEIKLIENSETITFLSESNNNKTDLITKYGEKIYNLKTVRNFLIGLSICLLTSLIIEVFLKK